MGKTTVSVMPYETPSKYGRKTIDLVSWSTACAPKLQGLYQTKYCLLDRDRRVCQVKGDRYSSRAGRTSFSARALSECCIRAGGPASPAILKHPNTAPGFFMSKYEDRSDFDETFFAADG